MDNPWLDRRVLNFAHRGGAFEGPSSTLFAIETALGNGADAIEIDVHQTRDGVLVVSHDPTVDRTSNGEGEIAKLDYEEIERLDNAYYFVSGSEAVRDLPADRYLLRGHAPGDHRFGFARLEEVLVSFPNVFTNIDIKRGFPDVPPYEAALAKMLRSHKREGDVIVASFNDRSTKAFAQNAPEIGTSPGIGVVRRFVADLYLHKRPSSLLSAFVALQLPAGYHKLSLITARLIDQAHELGLAVHAWTIDERAEMERLIAIGVDGIISNRPTLVSSVLSEKKVRYLQRHDATSAPEIETP